MSKQLYQTILLAFFTFHLNAQNIPPKSSLGIYLAKAPTKTNGVLMVQSVQPQSTAEKIKLQAGDVLLSINDKSITETNVLLGTLKAMKVGDPIKLEILREGKTIQKKGKMLARRPTPHSENAEIILEEVPFREGYIRCIINKPKGKGVFKTIYFLQGYPCQSMDWQNPGVTFKRLVHRWVDKGYAVVRVEKPGIGEYVNCKECVTMTFDDELEGFENGYKKILELPYLDNDNIILYGHSLGGNVAPFLAAKYQPKGVAVYGTVLKTWEEYLIDMTRNQQPLLGEDYADNEDELRIVRELLYHIFTNRKSPQSLMLTNREKAILKSKLGVDESGLMIQRSVAFWQSLNDHNFTKYWKNINSKVLAMYGESDVEALNENDAKRIAEIVNHYHPNNAQFALIPNTDHGLAQIEDKNEWLILKRSGQYSARFLMGISPDFLKVVDTWIQSVFSGEKVQMPEKITLNNNYIHAKYNLPTFITDDATMDVEAADLDQDQDLDLVLAMEGKKNIILFNNGKGNFTQHKILEPKFTNSNPKITGEDSEDVAVVDFDNDGDLDLFFVSEDTKHHELVLNEGNGNFINADFDFAKTINANALAVLDLNQDGFMDIIIGNRGQNQAFINLKNGRFEEKTDSYLPKNEDHTQDLKLVDIDNDGDLDLLEGAEVGGSNLYIFENNRFQEVKNAFPNIANYETRKIITEDINQDGKIDVLLCNVGWDAQRNSQNLIFLNQGSLKFQNVTNDYLEPENNTTLDAVFIDLNQDKRKDLITANGWGSTSLKVFLNEKKQFKTIENPLPQIKNAPATALISADFNGDGIADLYLGNYNATDVLILSQK